MKRILCVVLALMLVSGTAAFAASAAQQITVYPNTATFAINSNNVDIPNTFNYNGTIYVPIRAVSENLGMSVTWLNSQKVVLINNRPEQAALQYILLSKAEQLSLFALSSVYNSDSEYGRKLFETCAVALIDFTKEHQDEYFDGYLVTEDTNKILEITVNSTKTYNAYKAGTISASEAGSAESSNYGKIVTLRKELETEFFGY